ncbi:MAG: Multidrug resistance protein MdtK [Candidatus Anoxychlamydiales bacterium]|nr:Multidrug resistance protein MdtK [Candidatus Anoxychlamydiales bacterium]
MNSSRSLTKFKQGSMKELWTIALPLMISALASLLMIVVDRCFLARLSLDALNASVNAGTLAWAFLGGFGVLTVMSEVFVAQYNGADLHDQIGVPVWQMIWFSFFSILIFVPCALFIGPLIFRGTSYDDLQIQYFGYLMLLGPFYPLMTALSGFFIGRGQTRLLIYVAIIANFLNLVLDAILIFGIKNFIPAYGMKGAAIATGIGTIFQAIVLGIIFFKKENREKYGTTKWRFNFSIFKKCVKVGLPPAVFFALEIVGWTIFYMMMTSLSEVHITISSICQSIVILLSFFFDGLNRAVAALAGNFIGSKKIDLIHSLLKSSLKLLVIFTVIVSVFLVFDPKIIVDFLIPGNLENKILLWQETSGFSFYTAMKVSLLCVFIYLFFQGIRWIFAGLLTAAGDTLFLLLAGSFSVWIFLLLPVYLIVVKFSLPVQVAWILAASYAIILSIIYWFRYKKGRWKDIILIPDNEKVMVKEEIPLTLDENIENSEEEEEEDLT